MVFRGSKHLLTRYLEDLGCLGYMGFKLVFVKCDVLLSTMGFITIESPFGVFFIFFPTTENIAPTNGWLEYYFPIGEAYFQGRAVSFREGK